MYVSYPLSQTSDLSLCQEKVWLNLDMHKLVNKFERSKIYLMVDALFFYLVERCMTVKTPRCFHLNKSYFKSKQLYFMLCMVVVTRLRLDCGWNPKVWPFKWKLLRGTFFVVLFITLYKVALTFESVDEILKCYQSNKSYWAVLSCGCLLCCTSWF